MGKNTLPAIVWAAMKIEEKFGPSKVAVLPSDQYI
jgi:mannose-1-phosphate guanylyltransferase/mannose-6-phosphate isomerase